ncbi:MAG: SMUG2 DNA glycosylase family protein, partial [Candidatus Zixiibacteriota bacterium]
MRKILLGINPGRLGAGATGIPFTDTKSLSEICEIPIESIETHEPSSVFIYELIDQYGGVDKFYSDFYINSVCPLGFLKLNKRQNWVNCNYYDNDELFQSVRSFIIS